MIIYIFKKICTFLFLLFVLAQLSFCLVYFVPHSIYNHLNVISAYQTYFMQLSQGQFILISGEHIPFWQTVFATFELCLLALFISMLIGIPAGILLGLNQLNWLNSCIRIGCLIFYACPIVMISLIVLYFVSSPNHFVLDFEKAPSVSGLSLFDLFRSSIQNKWPLFVQLVQCLFLPTIILAIQPCILTIQLVSENVKQTAGHNYIKMAIIRDISSFKILSRHLLPNSIPSILPQLTYNTNTLLFSTMVIEILFNRVGLGQWILMAYHGHNYFIISIALLACGFVISSLSLLSEILALVIYPRRHKEIYA